jgi:acetate kinase
MTTVNEFALVLNSGSSSLKFAVFHAAIGSGWPLAARGNVEGIGTAPRMSVRDAAGTVMATPELRAGLSDAAAALESVFQWLGTHFKDGRLVGVGHRVVHGGPRHAGPVIVTPQVLAELRELVPFAPLHQPYNLAGIEAVARHRPAVPQVACFDTSFHRTMPAVAKLLALPADARRGGVERYGFHGLSYEYIASVLPQIAPGVASGRVIVAHLGNGASLCALRNRVSVATTMGFTALDGLCMGTRPGSIDPGAILYLLQTLRLSAAEVQHILYEKSGLLGISGVSNDMRTLLTSTEPSAALAVEYFGYRAAQEIGALTATLGGLDALVFTGGIGENSPVIRRRVCEACAWLGIELDEKANSANDPCISSRASAVSAWMIPTNEELMIARHTGRLLALGERRS